MLDVVFVAATVAFFALGALYVQGCARIVGREAATDAELGQELDPDWVRSEVTS